jgi:hypothetical protein
VSFIADHSCALDAVGERVCWGRDAYGKVAYTDATTTTESGDTVSEGDFGALEDWTCPVTPSDGEDGGEGASASITTL